MSVKEGEELKEKIAFLEKTPAERLTAGGAPESGLRSHPAAFVIVTVCRALSTLALIAAVVFLITSGLPRRETPVPGTEAQTAAPSGTGGETSPGESRTALPETAEEAPLPAEVRLLVRNESGLPEDGLPDPAEFSAVFPPSRLPPAGGSVMIVSSHGTERCSAGCGAPDAGEWLRRSLVGAGIAAFRDAGAYDAEGSLGAYARMNAALAQAAQERGIVLLCDVHSSDCGTPVTLTVGTGAAGWRDNYLLAAAVAARLPEGDCTLRLVPGAVGQGSGVPSLHIGIGGAEYGDAELNEILSALETALIALMTGGGTEGFAS